MYHLTQPTKIESLFALGEYLRDVREGQRFSIEEAAKRLHIRAMYLKALESGDWSELPGQAYGRGYLRQYAVFLGLSSDEVMQILDRIQGKVSTRLHYFETESTEQAPSHSVLWFSLLAIILLIGLWQLLQNEEYTFLAEDYRIPPALVAQFADHSAVQPSPYPENAQECMKLMQKAEIPCYWKKPVQMWPMLAYRLPIKQPVIW